MRKKDALEALSALGNETRLDAFMTLVSFEPHGMFATDLADRLKVAKNTMSPHFRVLQDAKLVTAKREGRNIRYRANLKSYENLVLFMVKDCCIHTPDVIGPLVGKLRAACAC